MRVSVAFLLAAILMCGAPVLADPPAQTKESSQPKKEKTNFLNADNGLGAAALGEIGLTVGAMAFAGPQRWQGYQRGDDGIPFVNDTAAGLQTGDCAAREGGDLAKALMAQNDAPQKPPPDGVLRMTDAERQSAASAFDSKAIYQAGQPATCNEN